MRWVKRILALGTMAFLIAAAGILYAFLQATKDAQSEIDQIEQKFVVPESKSTTIYSADNQLLYELKAENRMSFRLADVPLIVRNAFIAAEDRRFYTHPGVDAIGMARVLFLAAKEGKASQGGSTLTMQLAKLFVNGNEHSFNRKLKDIAVATQLEKLKTKDQILELYLQRVYFGEGAHGLGSAAETYFGKKITDLTLGEAAMLARCVRRPSSENPLKNLDRAITNRNVVLSIMLQDGTITQSQHDEAEAEVPKLKTASTGILASRPRAPYFVDDVIRRVRQEFPDLDLQGGGYRIETTLRTDIQAIAEKAVQKVVLENRRNGVSQGAFILVNSDGQILAEIGGVDYQRSQWNVVTQARRQPGSSFKPIVYATALATGALTANQPISNAPIRKKDPSIDGGFWVPKNDSKKENLPYYSLNSALAGSINLCAIHTIEAAGVGTVVSYARDTFGIRSRLDPTEPLALGASGVSPIEMAEAYSVFMLRGDRIQPTPIQRVLGPDGRVIRTFTATRIPHVLDPGVCDVMDQALASVVAFGTGREASPVPNARGKTGTTSSHRDAWFCGYSDGLVGIGWVGNLNNSPMSKTVYGGKVTIDFWREIMLAAHELNLHRVLEAPPVPIAIRTKVSPVPTKSETDLPTDFDATGIDESIPPDPEPTKTKPPRTVPPPEDLPEEGPIQAGNAGETIPVENEPPEKVPTDPPVNRGTPREKPVRETRRSEDDPARESVPRSKKPKVIKPREAETVEVEICGETGLKATMYCNETVVKKFVKGKEPRRACQKHRGDF